jgi:hypothetical protein
LALQDEMAHLACEPPEEAAERLTQRVARADPAAVRELAMLVVRVFGERLARYGEGLDLLDRLAERVGPADAVDRAAAALHLCMNDREAAERRLDRLEDDPVGNEAQVLAAAAAACGANGEPEAASRWLARAASLGRTMPDHHPAIEAVARAGARIAAALLASAAGRTPTETERALMRAGAEVSRTWWERLGDRDEIARAECLMSTVHSALGQPLAAAAHAEACRALLEANGAGAEDRLAALDALARACIALGATDEALAARSGCAEAVEELRDPGAVRCGEERLSQLDALLRR